MRQHFPIETDPHLHDEERERLRSNFHTTCRMEEEVASLDRVLTRLACTEDAKLEGVRPSVWRVQRAGAHAHPGPRARCTHPRNARTPQALSWPGICGQAVRVRACGRACVCMCVRSHQPCSSPAAAAPSHTRTRRSFPGSSLPWWARSRRPTMPRARRWGRCLRAPLPPAACSARLCARGTGGEAQTQAPCLLPACSRHPAPPHWASAPPRHRAPTTPAGHGDPGAREQARAWRPGPEAAPCRAGRAVA